MTKQAKIKTLYDSDFALWIEETIKQLKDKNTKDLDWENLIEEIESLGKRDKRELKSRLVTLFEHALKRCYVPLPDCHRGWEVTISCTQQKLISILSDSPSLRHYLSTIMDECYQNALKVLQKEYDTKFPEISPFVDNIDSLLYEDFYLNSSETRNS